MLIGYARVSSAGDRQSTQWQVLELVKAGVDERNIYQDNAPGSSMDRPGLVAALGYCQAGDTLVTWKLDRLSRSLKDLVATVDDLKARGVGLWSLTEAIDTTGPQGALMMHIFGALAEFERELARERIIAGVQGARAQGRVGGRPRAVSLDQLALIIEMRKTMTQTQVARALKMNRSTLANVVRRERQEQRLGKPLVALRAPEPGEQVDIEEITRRQA